VLTFATGTNTCVLDTLWLCDNTGEAVGGWGFAKSPKRPRRLDPSKQEFVGAMSLEGGAHTPPDKRDHQPTDTECGCVLLAFY